MGDGSTTLSGQWLGRSVGDPAALVVMDLDSINGRAQGRAYLYPDDNSVPSSVAEIQVKDSLAPFKVSTRVGHFENEIGYFPTKEELNRYFPDVDFPFDVEINAQPKEEDSLELNWKTEVGTFGNVTLKRDDGRVKSTLAPESNVNTWSDFQAHVTRGEMKGMAFRGQAAPWPLRTSFHRTRRRDLVRYLGEDIPRLHRALSSRTRHVFDLSKPFENGAFLNLAQHHGFPTPLLDWTLSPFVAAYFAFSSVTSVSTDDRVQILAFDYERYGSKFPPKQNLTYMKPHFSILEALSIENDRALPQQGLLTLTNLENIEDFLEFQERGADRFLFAYELPASQKAKVLSDLELMGIKKSTLFLGIDSICAELRDRHFF